MAYDEELAERVRELVATESGVTERKMFGGLAFLVDGAMAVCASSRGALMVRVDPAEVDELVESGPAEPMVMRGRPMTGWVLVTPSDDDLASWVDRGCRRARAVG